MDRVEQAGLGVAVIGHGALFAALALAFMTKTDPPEPGNPAIEVELVGESLAPAPTPAPLAAPVAAPVVEDTPAEPSGPSAAELARQAELDKAEAERKAAAQAAAAKATREEAAREKLARDKALSAKAEADRKAREKLQKDAATRSAAEKAAREKAAREKATLDKLAKDRLARAQAARDQAAKDKASRDKAAQAKAAQQKAAAEKAALDKAARDQAAKDKAAAAQAAREKTANDAQAKVAAGAAARKQAKHLLGSVIGPRFQRCVQDGADANQILTDIDVFLNPDGSVDDVVVVGQSGINDSNRTQASPHRACALRAAQSAPPFTTLPRDQYESWRKTPMRLKIK